MMTSLVNGVKQVTTLRMPRSISESEGRSFRAWMHEVRPMKLKKEHAVRMRDAHVYSVALVPSVGLSPAPGQSALVVLTRRPYDEYIACGQSAKTVTLRVPAHAPWLARRSLVHRVTRMTCHAPVRTGGAVGAGSGLD